MSEYEKLMAKKQEILEKKQLSIEADGYLPVWQFYLKGTHFDGRKDYIIQNVNELTELNLENDFNNPVSDTAIAVKHLDKIIGYVSAEDVEFVQDYMDDETKELLVMPLSIELVDDKPWLNIEIEIYER